MAEVQISEVDAKPAPVSFGLSGVKYGSHRWAAHESTVKMISLLEPTVEQWDLRVPIVAQQWNLRAQINSCLRHC
jgi:hypothetical protein